MAICALSKKGKYLVGITITKTMEGKTNEQCVPPLPHHSVPQRLWHCSQVLNGLLCYIYFINYVL